MLEGVARVVISPCDRVIRAEVGCVIEVLALPEAAASFVALLAGSNRCFVRLYTPEGVAKSRRYE